MADNRSAREKALASERQMIGPDLNFASSEAYKMLRTNLQFALPVDEKCHVIGVTSTYKGEGKSIASINLAYTLSEAGNKVIVIEGDMRLPTLARRLKVKPNPGLTTLMVESDSINSAIQHTLFKTRNGDEVSFSVVTAGKIPPNPSELMQSNRMRNLIEALKGYYDVIILDLPPVTVVTDALIASKYLSGMILVVRNEVASKKGLSETLRQMKQADVKILGFVYTDADFSKSRTYGKNYKKGYYNYYR